MACSVPKTDNRCAVCEVPATQACSSCLVTFYCSREHQQSNWKTHKQQCRPYQVEVRPITGRTLVAKRAIKAGELILSETPLAFGPKQLSAPMCVGCHESWDSGVEGGGKRHHCSRCGWPLCRPTCEESPFHSAECEMIQGWRKERSEIDVEKMKNAAGVYGCICILRCLWLKDHDATKWAAVSSMESHVEVRRQLQADLCLLNQHNVVGFVRSYLGFSEMSKEEESVIHELCGIWDTNAFEIRHGTLGKLRALFKTARFMAHDCRANTKHGFEPFTIPLAGGGDNQNLSGAAVTNFRIVVRATVPIAAGEPITACYTQPLSNTMARRAHLEFAKRFICGCARCRDPTEFGAYLTAWKCPSCDGGRLVAENAENPDGEWRCDGCEHSVPCTIVKDMEKKVNSHFAKVGKTVKELEGFLSKFNQVMLPTTSYAVQVKYALIQLLPTEENSLEESKRKEELCREMISLMDKLCPGMSRVRGLLLHHLYEALLFRARTEMDGNSSSTLPNNNGKAGKVSKGGKRRQQRANEAAAAALKEAKQCLDEALSILKQEPSGSSGRELARNAEVEELPSLEGLISRLKI